MESATNEVNNSTRFILNIQVKKKKNQWKGSKIINPERILLDLAFIFNFDIYRIHIVYYTVTLCFTL